MIQNNHTISLMVGGRSLDLDGTDSLNLRMNTVLYDPTKIVNKTGEYSFSFSLPITKTNAEIFDHADIASKPGKFNKRWNCDVYSDGHRVFSGQIRIASIEEGHYKVNLVQTKVGELTDIFGEDTMHDFKWEVDYNGFQTISEMNESDSPDVFFPLVCYGPFIKVPYTVFFNEYNQYTSKFAIDEYTRFYHSSFPPAPRLNELVRRLFERKGYSVSGEIFDDESANRIYLSTNLSDGQVPLYNFGRPSMGNMHLEFEFMNRQTFRTAVGEETFAITPIIQDLQFPYEKVQVNSNRGGYSGYNFDRINVYDVFNSAAEYQGYVNHGEPPTGIEHCRVNVVDGQHGGMWRENCIVIPVDGAYKITIDAEVEINDTPFEYLTIQPSTGEYNFLKQLEPHFGSRPIELQLVRNSDEVELIRGYCNNYTVYPHEAPRTQNAPATRGERRDGGVVTGTRNRGNDRGSAPTRSGGASGGIVNSTDADTRAEEDGFGDPSNYGLGMMPKYGQMLCYDPYVNPDFICGFTTMSDSPSVMKNGYSWNPGVTQRNYSRYQCEGYFGVRYTDDYESVTWTPTEYNRNTYPGCPLSGVGNVSSTKKHGVVSCMMNLNAGDILILKVVTRNYETASMFEGKWREEPWYDVHVQGSIKVEPYSPIPSDSMSEDLTWNSPSKFSEKLNVAEFLSDSTRQADFIQNYINAFNLSFSTDGNTAVFESNKKSFSQPTDAVMLDDRLNTSELTFSPIGYPRSMEVQYTVSDEEYGFSESVPKEFINSDDWKDHADVGSEPVVLSADEDDEQSSMKLSNSYTWYGNFSLYGKEDISIPVISKDEYMIDNYKEEESMLSDGFGLTQRWFMLPKEKKTVKVTGHDGTEVTLRLVSNTDGTLELSYMNRKGTLLDRYFNTLAYTSSDMMECEVWLSAEQYMMLKKGALIRVNSDVYVPCEITGYDPTGNNKAKIRAMKKA